MQRLRALNASGFTERVSEAQGLVTIPALRQSGRHAKISMATNPGSNEWVCSR